MEFGRPMEEELLPGEFAPAFETGLGKAALVVDIPPCCWTPMFMFGYLI